MTRKRGRPAPDDVRCPTCSAVAWRRVGERIDVERPARGPERLVHAFERGDGPWEWTCGRCGYAVRPAGALDKALARVQPARVPAIIGGLFGIGAGGAAGSPGGGASNASRVLQAGALAAAGVAAAVVVAVVTSLGGGPGATPTPSRSAAAAATPAGTVTELAALADAGPELAGRRLELQRAEVTRVTGDTTFWLAAPGSEAFVVLDENQQPEESVTVRPGQHVRLTGTVHKAPPDGVELSGEDRAALEEIPVYVAADWVEVVED